MVLFDARPTPKLQSQDRLCLQLAKMYALIKLHTSITRSSYKLSSSTAYKLSSNLIKLINTKTTCSHKYSINNSPELVEKIKSLHILTNVKLVSFDVMNLLEKLLSNNNLHLLEATEIIDLLTVCLKQNYFRFNTSTYLSISVLILWTVP